MAYQDQISAMAGTSVKHDNSGTQFEDLINQFKRYRELNDRRVFCLQKELQNAHAKLTKLTEAYDKIKDIETVQKSRERLLRYQKGEHAKPLETPIDRTGVAPKDVQIEKIFNCAPGGNITMNKFR